MNLNRVAAEIRPRKPWEAVDLGVLMARHWWWPLTRAWLLIALPPTLLLHLLLPPSYLWLSTLLMWWLKPLWERPLLYILSQALFGRLPGTGETLRACPGLLRRHWLGPLTWLRLSPGRSMDLPVSQLEQLTGAQRRNRVLVLHREDAAPAGWLTIIGVHLETALVVSAYLLLYFFIPDELDVNFTRLLQQDAFWWLALQNAIYFLVMAVVAPFYVACGFALYLNRRIKLEGWDIEIAFRRIMQKRSPTQPRGPAAETGTRLTAVAAFALCCTLLLPPTTGRAQTEIDAEHMTIDRIAAKQRIGDILEGEAFHQKEFIRTPNFFDDEPDLQLDDNPLPGWAEKLLTWLANSIEAIIWALMIALVVVLSYRHRHWIAQLTRRGTPAPAPHASPGTLFGLEVTRASLPENVSQSALSLWQRGQTREAVALLYRASLAHLIARGLNVGDGSTEGECVERVKTHEQPATVAYFAALTQTWQHLAYGHRQPTEQQIVRLCEQWPECIRRQPTGAAQL